jgi:hypothetical protein
VDSVAGKTRKETFNFRDFFEVREEVLVVKARNNGRCKLCTGENLFWCESVCYAYTTHQGSHAAVQYNNVLKKRVNISRKSL